MMAQAGVTLTKRGVRPTTELYSRMKCGWKMNEMHMAINLNTFKNLQIVLSAMFCFQVYDASCTHQQTMTTRRFVCTIVILSAKLT